MAVPGQASIILRVDPLAPGDALGPMLSRELALRSNGGGGGGGGESDGDEGSDDDGDDDVEGVAAAHRTRIAMLKAQLAEETAALEALPQKRRRGAAA